LFSSVSLSLAGWDWQPVMPMNKAASSNKGSVAVRMDFLRDEQGAMVAACVDNGCCSF
jgi:hypothetical protein